MDSLIRSKAMDSEASLLTDGLTTEEQQMSPLRGMRHKACREANFPVMLLEKALTLNISHFAAFDMLFSLLGWLHGR